MFFYIAVDLLFVSLLVGLPGVVESQCVTPQASEYPDFLVCPSACSNSPCIESEDACCRAGQSKVNGCNQCESSFFKKSYNHPCTHCQLTFGDQCMFCQDFHGCGQCISGCTRIYDSQCQLWKCECDGEEDFVTTTVTDDSGVGVFNPDRFGSDPDNSNEYTGGEDDAVLLQRKGALYRLLPDGTQTKTVFSLSYISLLLDDGIDSIISDVANETQDEYDPDSADPEGSGDDPFCEVFDSLYNITDDDDDEEAVRRRRLQTSGDICTCFSASNNDDQAGIPSGFDACGTCRCLNGCSDTRKQILYDDTRGSGFLRLRKPFQRYVGQLTFTDTTGCDYDCSATLIDSRIIITAGHCVHSGNVSPKGYFTNFRFFPRKTIDNTSPSNGIPIVSRFAFSGWRDENDYGWDIGILELAYSPNIGYARLGYKTSIFNILGKLRVGAKYYTNGYPCDKYFGSMWLTSGRITELTRHEIRTSIYDDVTNGNSGGSLYTYPVYNFFKRPVIYGILSRRGFPGDNAFASFARITKYKYRIIKLISNFWLAIN